MVYTPININPNVFFVFLIWVVFSSLFYLPELLSGNIGSDRETNVFLLVFRYLVCLFFSIYAFRRNFLACSYIVAVFVVGCVFYTDVMKFELGTGMRDFAIICLIFSCFFGFPMLFSQMTGKQLKTFHEVFLLSGLFVVFFSFYQFFVLPDLYSGYWSSVGSIRLTSTLLNPNNLGVFLSVCFLLLLFYKGHVFKRLFLAPFFFLAIFMSGSKSALFLLCFFVFIYFSFKKPAVVFLSILLALFVGLIYEGFIMFDISTRVFDLSTGSLRVSMQLDYFSGFDLSYFIPDFERSRFNLVQEHSYLMVVNSVGVVAAGLFLLSFLFFYGFSIRLNIWFFLILFYLVSLSLNNILNSYPNNMFFFFFLGAFFRPRRAL